MPAAADPWAPLTPADAARLLEGLTVPWWLAGGWALELTGDAPRPHGDLDVAILRPGHEALAQHLSGWDLRVARHGRLAPWDGLPVQLPANAIWARPSPSAPWHLDVKLELVDGDEWVYRRDPTIRMPVAEIGATTDGIPHLRRELLELYARRGDLSEGARLRPRSGRR